MALSNRFPHTIGTRMTFCTKNRIIERKYIGANKNHFFILLELARIATLRTTKETAGEMMFFDVQGLELVDFFGAFALVTMDHVLGDILLLSDTSDMLVVKTDGFSLICRGAESISCRRLDLGPFKTNGELESSRKLLGFVESFAGRPLCFFLLPPSLSGGAPPF